MWKVWIIKLYVVNNFLTNQWLFHKSSQYQAYAPFYKYEHWNVLNVKK